MFEISVKTIFSGKVGEPMEKPIPKTCPCRIKG